MKSQQIIGTVKFDNYSQTQIRLTAYDDMDIPYYEYFFDKKTLSFNLPTLPDSPDGYYTFCMMESGFIRYYFTIGQITSPATKYVPELLNILNSWIYGEGMSVSLNGGPALDPLRTLNFIEGSNITITESYNSVNNTIDVTIDASGGGGGLPPDGTYGDVVVSGAGTIWTVTDDTSNQQVAVYEDSFLRGTRPSLNFYDDGGPVSVTVTDDSVNNRVDIEITSTGIGTVTSVTATSPITSTGGATPNISTQVAKGKLIGRNSVTAGVMEEISVGSGLLLSGTILTTTAVSPIYLVAYDRNSQTAGGANTGYPMTFDTLVERNDINFSSSSAVRFNSDGVYNVQFSAQFANYDNQEHDVDIWFVLNRAPINWSNSRFSIIGTHGGINGHYIAAWNYMSTFSLGDELEIYWQTDDTRVQIETIPSSGDAPDTPSIILTIDKL